MEKRRAFLILCGASFFVPVSTLLASDQKKILQALVEILIPYSDKQLQDAAHNYIIYFIFTHPTLNNQKRKFLKKSLLWLNTFSIEKKRKSFDALAKNEQQYLLEELLEHDWGKEMITHYTTLLLEATLGDPIYGINPKGMGWERVGFTPGFPRPKRIYRGS
ncbi:MULTISPECIES: gluconate 2-dehydrogenase subunit 3 family protein [unclassified Nitratiruptor]|uniref:gluconate 2-dehydrogenase subunit 3 family protein n=1 Tax=unclassified Nitratiruptor TaxID=2624044 RepID=UPI001916A9F6|nr:MULTISPECIES: gluconate 2-dehydrogenase subunit 3 family protein [unclassified Nitratiruptor]BCD59290.1 hypothetical protein NitYY0810_C0020 [Nitratiruptor sp. YY08-10]BCD63214.1 hypothetical protein NitYY0814_C0020 [Nitratiruptor sp. YY08-14]